MVILILLTVGKPENLSVQLKLEKIIFMILLLYSQTWVQRPTLEPKIQSLFIGYIKSNNNMIPAGHCRPVVVIHRSSIEVCLTVQNKTNSKMLCNALWYTANLANNGKWWQMAKPLYYTLR